MNPASEDRRMIGALLRIPFQAIVARIHGDLVRAGFDDLRPAHFVVFQQMDPGGVRLTELAERGQMTKQSMGYLVDFLEKHGYVERAADPADGRARLVRLTARGAEVERISRDVVRRIESEWSRLLGGERFDQLQGSLRELSDELAR